MFGSAARFAFLLPLVTLVHGQSNQTSVAETTGFPPCDALISAGLGERVLLASSDDYEPRVQTWFSASARYRPWCFVLPTSTDELSAVVKALNTSGGAGEWHVAVRSGGHSYPGSNNIAHGVTIDLGMMNSSSYDADKGYASVQPGARWGNVYRNLLDKYNVTVTGGRDGSVGVGGFLLGGGNSYFTGRNGFGCDNVLNYEVVLANGTVVNANESQNPDLWKALKGGALNFGIVSRFDLRTEPAIDVAYGRAVFLANSSNEVMEYLSAFTDNPEELGADHTFATYVHDTDVERVPFILVAKANTKGDLNTTTFDTLDALPAVSNSWEHRSLADIANSSQPRSGRKGAGATLTFLNSPDVLKQVSDLHTELIASLSAKLGPKNFGIEAFFQPLPTYFHEIAERQGGNVLGMDAIPSNAILWTAGMYSKAKNEEEADAMSAFLHAELRVMVGKMKAIAMQDGKDSGWVYLNYAEASEDPLGSYGKGNVDFMRAVADKYDPEGFWQKRVPGGFKLARVRV